tara:strand:+ start:119 stop:493 length:375 start_codon:yes stop_codon:yes gene_type:complete
MAKRTRRRSRSRRKRQRGGEHDGTDEVHEPEAPDEPMASEGSEVGSLLGGKRRRRRSSKSKKGGKKARRTRKKSKSRKGKKRPLNAYFKLMLNAKKKGLASFKYKGKTYKGKKHNRLGMIYRKA